MADIPGAPAKDLSNEVVEQIQGVGRRAQQTEPEMTRAALMGIEDSRSLLKTDSGFDQGLSYDGGAMSGAISRRAMQKYDREMQRLGVNTKMDNINRRFSRLTQAAQLTSEEIQHNERVKQARYIQEQHRKQARGAALGSILGVVGAVAGGFFGGPAGAAAGSAVGKGLGEEVGGR